MLEPVKNMEKNETKKLETIGLGFTLLGGVSAFYEPIKEVFGFPATWSFLVATLIAGLFVVGILCIIRKK